MPPISLLIKPASGLCQYRCRYCFYQDVMNSRETGNTGIMNREVMETLIRRALAYAEGMCGFAFQGGEPTLAGLAYFRAFADCVKKQNSRGIPVQFSIQTNGGNINDEWAEFFRENRFLVGLSMDGPEEIHNFYRPDSLGNGTFGRTKAAAEILRRHGVDFNILTVVNKDIAAHPTETYETLKEYGFLQFIPCIEDFGREGRMFSPDPESYGRFLIETFDLYYKDICSGSYVSVRTFDNYVQMLLGKRPESCSMTGRCACYFVIEGNGDVYPCDFYVLDEWKIGNIQTDDFRTMLKSKRAGEFVASSVYVDPECRTCPHYSLCRGGCRRDREPFDDFGRPGKNRYCESYKMFFEARKKEILAICTMIRGTGNQK